MAFDPFSILAQGSSVIDKIPGLGGGASSSASSGVDQEFIFNSPFLVGDGRIDDSGAEGGGVNPVSRSVPVSSDVIGSLTPVLMIAALGFVAVKVLK